MESPARARMQRYNQVWWLAFLVNIAVGTFSAATGGFWGMVAWVHAAAAVLMILSRRRFHRRMRALGVDANGSAIRRYGPPK